MQFHFVKTSEFQGGGGLNPPPRLGTPLIGGSGGAGGGSHCLHSNSCSFLTCSQS